MKISYRREIRHNYLIIDPEEIEWNGYESQMLAENQIEGILRFQLRQMDEGVRFYYEITSRQPLTRLLENKKVGAAELRRLVMGIAAVLERMEEYLLHEERVLLEPDYLYVEPESFRVFLCLIPGLQRDFSEDFGRLLEYLLGSVDHHDKECVILVYGMYQETRKENYGMEDVVRLLYQEKDRKKEGVEVKETIGERENMNSSMWLPDSRGFERQAVPEGERRISIDYANKRQALEREEGETETKGSRWKSLKSWFLNKFRKPEAVSAKASWEVMFPAQSELKEGFSMLKPAAAVNMADTGNVGNMENMGNAASIAGAIQQGTALLADFSRKNNERVLRALDMGEEDILIAYYPFIIGKQDNLVDYKLERDTVSRLHVRIDRVEEQYWIQDLNSTNGTMVGGKLLDNNESVELQPGDEIAIAQYRYRFE